MDVPIGNIRKCQLSYKALGKGGEVLEQGLDGFILMKGIIIPSIYLLFS